MFAEKPPDNYATYAALKTAKTELLSGDHDVFGDGTVILKSTPNQTNEGLLNPSGEKPPGGLRITSPG